MRDKLEKIIAAYEELEQKMVDPAVVSDPKEYARIAKEHADQAALVAKAREYLQALDDIEAAKEMLHEASDAEEKEMLQADISDNESKLPALEEDVKYMLIPGDPNDEKDTIVEIRAGVGGDEAAIFAGDLFSMYQRFAQSRGWKTEVLDASPGEAGGFKTIEFKVTGEKVYSVMKYESGVHRVQRVPVTEAGGRIHTSTATVAVLPEVDEVEVDLNPNDVAIDTYRSSGAGGQHINKTESAIRLTHRPTGIVVTCQDEKSQLKNKERAFKVLRSKLYEMQKEERDSSVAQARRSQVGSGDRSERIRTYNYPQNRVTDHRIDLTLYKLTAVLDGDLDDIIDALITNERAEKLGHGNGE